MPGAVVGFYGKLPARGDFVRFGLLRDFTDPWDDWLQSVLAGSRELMGEAWLPAFLEAPVWRFALPPGMCGTRAALGLMLPSVDRAGRYFPLTFAALQAAAILRESADAWLDACEVAGRAAVEQDASPETIAGMLPLPDLLEDTESIRGEWWSDGSVRVNASRMTLGCLPSPETYAEMLGAHTDAGVGTAEEGRWESTP